MFFDEPVVSLSKVICENTTIKKAAKVVLETINNAQSKNLLIIVCKNSFDVLEVYLNALKAGHAIMLLSSELEQSLFETIVTKYSPSWIYGQGNIKLKDYTSLDDGFWVFNEKRQYEIHSNLAVLLSTSGTTGSQKFVRLSYQNIQSNAESIVEYLEIDENERAVMNLPMSYSYGMSIVNSHLQAGAAILLTDESVMSKTFWEFVKEQKATSLAGVPFTYQMMQRIGFLKMELPHLKTLTQAGGRLNEKLVKLFAEYAKEQDKRFYVMYGQTEAAPRMSYIPPERVLEKTGSIGIAIPGGKLSVHAETNELIYRGPNVMMGYAECIEDLAKGDEMNGVLHTGDIATMDSDGYFTITGRMKRFIKLFGLRINLDDVEKKLEANIHTAIACTGNDDKLIIAVEQEKFINEIKESVERLYNLHKTAYKVVVIEAIPRFKNGKIDYVTLKERCL